LLEASPSPCEGLCCPEQEFKLLSGRGTQVEPLCGRERSGSRQAKS